VLNARVETRLLISGQPVVNMTPVGRRNVRRMIDFFLSKARSSRYRHAARHFMECSSLAANIGDYFKFENHDAFLQRLKKEHGRKSGFWSLIE
jgi:hypothetical protein